MERQREVIKSIALRLGAISAVVFSVSFVSANFQEDLLCLLLEC